MWSLEQGSVTLTILWEKLAEPQFYKDIPEKPVVLRGALANYEWKTKHF